MFHDEPIQLALVFPATWRESSRTWATRRGMSQHEVDAIEADLVAFRYQRDTSILARYERDKRHLLAAVIREAAAINVLYREQAEHLARAERAMRPAGMIAKTRESYAGDISKHKGELSLYLNHLRALRAAYEAAQAMVGSEARAA